MPKALSPAAAAESAELAAFLRFYLDMRRPGSVAMFDKGVAEIEAEFGRSKALIGLRQAVNDTIEDLADANDEALAMLDQALTERGLVSFSELRRRYSSQYKRLLKRGTIKNDTEFYIASGIASDLASQVSEDERAQLQRMIEAYEAGA